VAKRIVISASDPKLGAKTVQAVGRSKHE